ncbi:endonuclease MutS2 [bacterium]|nr:endonuclease MutS2 [bacterium]
MNPHALKVLDYAILLDYLSNYTESEVTRHRIRNLKPITNHKILLKQLDELSEFRYLKSSGQKIPAFSGPTSELFRSIESSRTRGWRLLPEKIFAIGDILIKAANLREGLLKLENIPLLKFKIKKLILLPELRNRILKTVNHKGEIEDRASQELGRIRRQMRKFQERIRNRMEELAGAMYKKGALQDPIVTIRNGRFVLPVRAGSARDVPGVIHDRSSSGATFFIEPKVSVADNCALGKLENEEFQETNRILTDITELIGKKAEDLLENLETVIQMDLLQAKARFCDEIKATPVTLKKTSIAILKDCRNPLLLLHRLYSHSKEENTKSVIPIDLTIDETNRILVITGPNTGGKTVALKTMGLTVLMVQTGLHPVCNENSSIGIFSDIYADIGDEQSLEQNLSTFSAHVKQIIEIIENADHNSLVLLDELGAGTDPAEGSALGISVLSDLKRRNAWVVATTHHNSIKAFAFTTQGIANAAMEFNIKTLEPTYRILMGRIGQSNALTIAERLGFPGRLIEEARKHMEGKILDLQEMLDKVEKSRISAEKQINRATSERSRAKELRKAREDVLCKAEKDARIIIEKATNKSQEILSELLSERKQLKEEIRNFRKKTLSRGIRITPEIKSLDSHGKKLSKLADKVSSLREQSYPERINEGDEAGDIQAGDTVWIKRFQLEANVITKESDKRVVVDVAGKKMRISVNDVQKVRSASRKNQFGNDLQKNRFSVTVETIETDPPELRLNLVGKRVDEALDELQRYMDQVIQCRISQITIIHGFGTGRLQDAVIKYLKRVKEVVRARSGNPNEGGGGVTVVEMNLGN